MIKLDSPFTTTNKTGTSIGTRIVPALILCFGVVLLAGYFTIGFSFFMGQKKVSQRDNLQTIIELPGWPYYYSPCSYGRTPAFGDIDPSYAGLEVVIADGEGNPPDCQYFISVFHVDGTVVPGWEPFQVPTSIVENPPIIADIAGDNQPEIIVHDDQAALDEEAHVYAFTSGGEPVEGWPYVSDNVWNTNTIAAMAAGNFDADSKMEIVVSSLQGILTVLDGNGQVMTGWPKCIYNDNIDSCREQGQSLFAIPTMADIDHDSIPEILTVSGQDFVFTPPWNFTPLSVFAYHINGEIVEGFPMNIKESTSCSEVRSSLAIDDINGDQENEILISCPGGSPDGQYNTAYVYALSMDGTSLPGWPVLLEDRGPLGPYLSSSPTVGDIDSDGQKEVLVGGGTAQFTPTKIYAYHADGSTVAGWPVTPLTEEPWGTVITSEVILADLDGDRDLEVLAGVDLFYEGYGVLVIYRSDGSEFIPPMNFSYGFDRNTPLVADLNQDRKLEIVMRPDALHVFTVEWTTADLHGWPEYRSNQQRTGVKKGSTNSGGSSPAILKTFPPPAEERP